MATAPIGNKVNIAAIAANIDAKALTAAGQQLKAAADGAGKIAMGSDRATAFGTNVLPLLLEDAVKHTGGDAQKLGAALQQAVAGAGSTEATLGLKNGEKGLAADTDYPPRAANAVWADFASALGISAEDQAAVTKLNEQIGSYPKAEGKYAPAFEALSPEMKELATKVSKSLLGENVKLTSTEQAFKANLVLNNLTWHMTNFERAAGDASRADPLARNNVFNTYSDNLAYASKRGGIEAVIDMAISDSYNAGKPGVGKATFAQPLQSKTSFDGVKANAQSERERLSGERPTNQQAPIPQRDIY